MHERCARPDVGTRRTAVGNSARVEAARIALQLALPRGKQIDIADSLAGVVCEGSVRDLAEATGLSEAEISRTLSGIRDLKVKRTVEILAFVNRPEHLSRLGRSEPFRFEELFADEAA